MEDITKVHVGDAVTLTQYPQAGPVLVTKVDPEGGSVTIQSGDVWLIGGVELYELPPEKGSPEKEVKIDGVGPDTPIIVNEQGAGQSDIPYRFDLLDPKTLFAASAVLKTGAEKYGEDNWRLLDVNSHLNHMIMHAYAYLAGDRSEEHLSHVVCRAMFAFGVDAADD